MNSNKSSSIIKKSASIEEILVLPNKPIVSPEPKPEVFEKPPFRRSRSDGELHHKYANGASFMSHSIGRINWRRLVEHLKSKRNLTKSEQELEVINAVLKIKSNRTENPCLKLQKIGRKLSTLFFGPMFYRHRFRFIIFLEVFVPIFVFLFITWSFTSGVSWKKAYTDRKAADAFVRSMDFKEADEGVLIEKFKKNYADDHGRIYLAFSPRNKFTVGIMEEVLKILKVDVINRVLTEEQHSTFGAAGVDDPTEVMEHCLLHRLDNKAHKNPIGVDFTLDNIDEVTELPHKFKMVIRTFDKTISETLESHPYVQPPRTSNAWYPPYVESGFISLQFAIQKAFLKNVYGSLNSIIQKEIELLVNVDEKRKKLQSLPSDPEDDSFPKIIFKLLLTPNYFDKHVRQLITVTICLILCFSYTGLSFFIVRQIVIEGQSGIKDFLSLHNMGKYLHWVIYFFHSLIFRTITAAGITLTLFIDYGHGAIFTNSNWIIVYIVIFLHLMSLSSFNFFLGTILTSVTFSGLLSVCLCFMSFVIPYSLVKTDMLSGPVNLITAILFPNWALWNAILDMVGYECDNIGVNWSNITVLDNGRSELTYFQCMLIMVGGNLTYFYIAMLHDLLPRKNLSVYFTWFSCLQSLFARRTRVKKSQTSAHVADPNPSVVTKRFSNLDKELAFYKPQVYEEVEFTQCFVKIRHLSKMFGQYKLVLDNLSLDLIHCEITVILGHATSGKTTLMQCLAGLVKPTTGLVRIHDIDIYQEKNKALNYIGFCPQDVILFNVLSVSEHLVLCYKLRGLSTKDAVSFADGLMELLRIKDVKKLTPSALTNDEKRKLSIALCLVDKPSVILLDEPTNGMEPLARHEIWNILKSLKQESHTIIVATSMMDEAEFLADRVALLSHGKLVCYGSPKFLKEQYHTGYYLRIVPNPAKFNLEIFQTLPQKHFDMPLQEAPEKTMLDQHNFLLILPVQQQSKFSDFFDELDSSKNTLGVLSYGTHSIGLSDIFIKVSEAVGLGTNPPDVYIRTNPKGEQKAVFWGEVPVTPPGLSSPSKVSHFVVMLQKLWVHGIGGNSIIFWEIFIPTLMIWLTVWHTRAFVTPPPIPVERNLVLSEFPDARVFFIERGLTGGDNLDWKNDMQKFLGTQGEELKTNEQIDSLIEKDEDEDRKRLQFTLEKRMVALELKSIQETGGKEFTAYYSSGSLHSPPLILGILGNIMLKAITNNMKPPPQPFLISVANCPFPVLFTSDFNITCGISCLMFGLVISFSLGFFTALLMTFPLHEKVSGMKQLQLMSGLHPFIYWSAYFCVHFIVCLLLTTLVGTMFLLDSKAIYTKLATLGTLVVIVGLYLCWSGLPWVYYLTTIVPNKVDGPIIGFIIHIIFAYIPLIILETGFNDSTDGFIIFLRYFFHLYPPYTVTSAVYIFFDIVSKRSMCSSLPDIFNSMCTLDKFHGDRNRYSADMKQIFEFVISNDVNLGQCCDRLCKLTNSCHKATPFFSDIFERLDQPRLLICLIAFILQGFIYWGLLMLAESRFISNHVYILLRKFLKKKETKFPSHEPKDIIAEKIGVDEAIENGECPEGTLMVCQDLTKSFIEHMIISGVNIELKKGDIVGILGGTDSGKSIVVQMITGEIVPTRGAVLIENLNLYKNRKEFLRRIGYCPQQDALFDNFTGKQMVELMGKLRGLQTSELSVHAQKWLQVLGLGDAANDICSMYSASMSRRLCVAMALIGGNSVLLFDVPTRGLDAIAKQRFWSVIQQVASLGSAVMFTSSNVNECEMNSSKLLVLSEGNVQCIGQPAELQRRFSRGYTFLIHICYDVLTAMEILSSTVGRIQDLKKTVEKKLESAILRDEQGNLLLYFVSAANLTWGQMFMMAEEIKEEHPEIVENYYISQATLDDVFVLLTNKYKNMDLPRSMHSSFPGEITQYEAETAALAEATKVKATEFKD